MKNRFGCLTGIGILAAVVTGLIVIGLVAARGGALFSPGALNSQSGPALSGVTAHADLSHRCASCHPAFWTTTTMADLCVACHADVTSQWQNPSTLHGSFHQQNPGLTCRSCHPDHQGADAPLTSIGNVNFAHTGVGYSLAAHARKSDGTPFACKDCHAASYAHFDQAVCVNCHQQINAKFMHSHQSAYGSTCLTCHDGIDTYGHNFNHGLVAFPLTGKHTLLDCGQCHTGARSIADLRAAPRACVSCHAKDDAHQGALGQDCVLCHTTNAWSPSTFDHSQSTFPLVGKHAEVPCKSCHADLIFKNTPTDCYSCHAKDDAHQGALGQNCTLCHTSAAWSPSTFDHNLSTFPLIGKHAEVPCKSCHADLIFKNTPTDCYSCHAKDDTHKGTFGQQCSLCHTPAGWLPATFDHNKFFPLTGAHAGLPCLNCHTGGKFIGLSTACVSCHADPAWHAGAFGTGCAGCHNTSAWSPATFNRSHPGGCGEGGNCVNHGGATCFDCHTVSVHAATCTKCHGSNNPGGDGGGGGGGAALVPRVPAGPQPICMRPSLPLSLILHPLPFEPGVVWTVFSLFK